MCGIIGVTSSGKVSGVNPSKMVRLGLERLEYRGYDSVGIASIHEGKILVKKAKGKVKEISKALNFDSTPGLTVIGHTRWATHGKPSNENAHPHVDCYGRIAVVHNGIIQNFIELRIEMEKLGHKFRSDTDTEVVAHLLEEYYKVTRDPLEALRETVKKIRGSYALGVLFSDRPDMIFFAKKDSPLIVGVGSTANFIASDIPAFLEYTNRVVVLRDGEIGYISPSKIYLERNGKPVDWNSRVIRVSWSPEDAAKGGYPYFMLKEIHEQPSALRETLRGLSFEVLRAAEILANSNRVFITAAGTSYHAGLIGAFYFKRWSKVLPYTFISSEYREVEDAIEPEDALIAISQSGETIDTLMAVRTFKEKGASVVSISNVVDSAIPRESDVTVYTRAGPEIGVAATKTFTTQVLVLELLALEYSVVKGLKLKSEYREVREALEEVPRIVGRTISSTEGTCKRIGEVLAEKQNAYYLGRGLGLPIAMEGALKLKEIAYIHAEAYPAGESKHGPIALVEPGYPTLFIVVDDHTKNQIIGNITEMKAREALTIGLIPRGDSKLRELLDFPVEIQECTPELAPYTYSPPLQLIAYYTSITRGYDPDKPRNLAKTVTVE